MGTRQPEWPHTGCVFKRVGNIIVECFLSTDRPSSLASDGFSFPMLTWYIQHVLNTWTVIPTFQSVVFSECCRRPSQSHLKRVLPLQGLLSAYAFIIYETMAFSKYWSRRSHTCYDKQSRLEKNCIYKYASREFEKHIHTLAIRM